MRNTLSLAVAALLLAACSPSQEPASPVPPPPPAANEAGDHSSHEGHEGHPGEDSVAIARLQPTAGNQVSGELMIRRLGDRLQVTGIVSGLKAGSEHGFHIHEKGDCSASDGSSAGGHFNPSAAEHGAMDAPAHHAGDMPNLVADANGVANVDGQLSAQATLGDGGSNDILGRGLIIHADPDDYASQPTGNAGARLACAVIENAG